MQRGILYVTLLAAVIFMGSAAGAKSAPVPAVEVATINAIEFCADASHLSKITIPAGYVLYESAQGALASVLTSKGIPTTADAPPQVQRFAATSTAARFGSSVDYIKAPANNGEVWIILGNASSGARDVMVTGVRNVTKMQESVYNEIRVRPKWIELNSIQSDAAAPIRMAIFSKSTPIADRPRFGVRLTIQTLRPDYAKSDGIQLEGNAAAGKLTITDTGINVSR